MRALGYCRVSSLEQATGTSLRDQQAAIEAHAKARGVALERCYVEAESGIHENNERREQMQALHRARAGGVRGRRAGCRGARVAVVGAHLCGRTSCTQLRIEAFRALANNRHDGD